MFLPRRFVRFSLPAILALAMVSGLVGPVPWAGAAMITVNTFTDELNTDGDCSLREAIRSANSDGVDPHDACVAGNGADTIDLPAGTYTTGIATTFEDAALDGDLDITADLTIQSTGGTAIVDGGDIEGVFHVTSGDADVTFSNVVIQNGYNSGFGAGGGIRDASTGTLTLTGVTVRDNEASAGGGITNLSGILMITNSTISGNRATESGQVGGGISLNSVTATVTNSTVSGNQGTNTNSNGGGIAVVNATLTLTNSTVSGNSVKGNGGGVFHNFVGNVTLNNTTLINNAADSDDAGGGDGGGIAAGGNAAGTISLRNSILAGNLDVSGGAPDCSGSVVSLGYNLIQDTTSCTFTDNNDVTGRSPLVGPLQDNGGPTQTHALQATSPAIDAANPSGCTDDTSTLTTDQRGEPRHVDGNADGVAKCDIGALEVQPPPPGTSPKTSKMLSLTAKPKRVEEGDRTRLTAAIAPCDVTTRDDVVEFQKGSKTIAEKAVNDACAARTKTRVKKKTSFRAASPEDADSLADTSNKVTVKIRQA